MAKNNVCTDNSKIITGISVGAVLCVILYYYGYDFLSLAFLFFACCILFAFIKFGRVSFEFNYPIIFFIVYYCIMRVLSNNSLRSMVTPSYIIIFFIYGFLCRYVQLNSFIKYYRIVAFINILFFIIQEIMYSIAGYRIPGILSFLPLTIGGGELDSAGYVQTLEDASRSSAFFSEPSHFAQFLLPLVAIELLYSEGTKSIIRVIGYIVILFILSSGTAFIGLFIIGLFFIGYLMKKLHFAIAIAISCLLVCGGVYAAIHLMESEYGEQLIERSEELDPNQAHISSGYIRIFRGYKVWEELSNKDKIFGLNSNDKLTTQIKRSSVAWAFLGKEEFLNGIQTIMINNGYIGLFLFLCVLISLWRNNNMAGKCCIALYVGLCLIASVFWGYTMIQYLLCAALLQKQNSRRNRLILLTIKYRDGVINNRMPVAKS